MNTAATDILQQADLDKLPGLSSSLLRIMQVCHSENLSYRELADGLKNDPVLFLRLHSLCHQDRCSADDSDDPEQKLQKLGINTIKSIAVTATVQQFFSRTSQARRRFIQTHWYHAVFTATVAESLARLIHYHHPHEAYHAGLLHDIGQLVLETAAGETYLTECAAAGDSIRDEQQHYHTDHAEVGAELLARHGLGAFVCDAVRFHHESTDALLDAHPLVKLVNLANRLCADDFDPDDTALFEDIGSLTGLSKALVLEMHDKSLERMQVLCDQYGVVTPRAEAAASQDKAARKALLANDERQQLQLAEQVRNIALLDGIHQHFSRTDGQQGLLDAVSQHTGILFGIQQSIVFLYNAGTDRLHAVSGHRQPLQLSDLSLPLQSGRSLVVDALLDRTPTHTFDASTRYPRLSVIDRQLLRMGGGEGFICLPMIMNNAAIGTLVLAVDEARYQQLWKQKSLLMRFVSEIAHTISAGQSGREHTDHNDSSHLEQLQKRIREVIHEVRNPLSIMNNYLGILSYKLEDDQPAQDDIKTIKTEIERVGSILDRLTEAPGNVEETSAVDINAIIADLTHMFQTSLFAANDIQITLDLDEQIQSLHTNANAIKQIYTNLIKNAVEILPTNGQIMVYTQDNVNVDGKQHIELSVADDGPGIDKTILPKLFSPVETTKGEDHAGLGLTIVKNLVSELHGSISCRSSDRGTSFHILLPKK